MISFSNVIYSKIFSYVYIKSFYDIFQTIKLTKDNIKDLLKNVEPVELENYQYKLINNFPQESLLKELSEIDVDNYLEKYKEFMNSIKDRFNEDNKTIMDEIINILENSFSNEIENYDLNDMTINTGKVEIEVENAIENMKIDADDPVPVVTKKVPVQEGIISPDDEFDDNDDEPVPPVTVKRTREVITTPIKKISSTRVNNNTYKPKVIINGPEYYVTDQPPKLQGKPYDYIKPSLVTNTISENIAKYAEIILESQTENNKHKKPKATSTKSKEEVKITKNDMKEWQTKLSALYDAEQNLFDKIKNIVKIEFKKLGASDIMSKYVTVKITIQEEYKDSKAKIKYRNISTMYLSDAQFTAKDKQIIKQNYKPLATEVKKNASVDVKNIFLEDLVNIKIKPLSSNKYIEEFSNAYSEFVNINNKVKQVKLNPIVLLKYPIIYNTNNVNDVVINNDKLFVEKFFYKNYGLLLDLKCDNDNYKINQAHNRYNLYKLHLYTTFEILSKPLTSKVFETIFENRFYASYFYDQVEYRKILEECIAYCIENLENAKFTNTENEIANIWKEILASEVFVDSLSKSYKFSTLFKSAFKSLYTDKVSIKFMLDCLYPISFLFTPFMARCDSSDNGVKARLTAKFNTIYNNCKGKVFTTVNIEDFFTEYIDNFQHIDWIWYLNKNNRIRGEICEIMSILYQRFDKGEIDESEEAPAEE